MFVAIVLAPARLAVLGIVIAHDIVSTFVELAVGDRAGKWGSS